MRVKLVHPLRSLLARQQASQQELSPYFLNSTPKGAVRNPHGIGGVLPGEPPRNITGKGGFGDNPPDHALAARYRGGFQVGQRANPYGRHGFKAAKVEKKMEKRKRTEEGESIVKEAKEIQEIARRMVPDALDALGKIVKSEVSSDMAKIAAYHALADRGYGRPTQTNINANIDADAKPNVVDGNELDKRITETLQRIESITSRERETLDSQERPADLRKLN